MKKIISLLLTLIMVFSLATVAFAEGETTTNTDTNQKVVGLASEDLTIYFKKNYTGNAADKEIYPVETLSFDVIDSTDKNAPELTISDKSTDGNVNPSTLSMTVGKVPNEEAGVYYYTIKETAGSTQGVNYTDAGKAINVTVWVYWEDVKNTADNGTETTTRVLKKAVTFTKPETGEKVNQINNEYDVYNLDVKKTISGALASAEQKFDIDVSFKAATDKKVASNATVTYTVDTQENTITASELQNGITKTISIKDGTTVTFKNIPAGVEYKVDEQDKHAVADPTKNDPATGYIVTGEVTTATALTADASVTINNDKDVEVETGISLDSAPYFLMLAVAVFGMVALVSKKRYEF